MYAWLDKDNKEHLWRQARVEGKAIRDERREREKSIVQLIEKQAQSDKDDKRKRKKETRGHEQMEVEIDLGIGNWVCVAYTNGWYLGSITEKVDENTVTVDFLETTRMAGTFKKPSRPHIETIKVEQIFTDVSSLVSTSRLFKMTEHEEVEEKYTVYRRFMWNI